MCRKKINLLMNIVSLQNFASRNMAKPLEWYCNHFAALLLSYVEV